MRLMTPKSHENDMKMTLKSHENDMKMTLEWHKNYANFVSELISSIQFVKISQEVVYSIELNSYWIESDEFVIDGMNSD